MNHIASLRAAKTFGIVLALICQTGCTETHFKIDPTAYLEIHTQNQGRDCKAILLAEGAARMDIDEINGTAIGRHPLTYFVPIDGEEVKGLIEVIDRIADTRTFNAKKPTNKRVSQPDYLLRVHHTRNDVGIMIAMSTQQMATNRFINGLKEEITDAAQTNLIESLYEVDLAEAHLAAQASNSAFSDLDIAADLFETWEGSFTFRYGSGIWEPGVASREYLVNGSRFTLNDLPAGPNWLKDQLKLTREVATELSRQRYHEYLKNDVIVTDQYGVKVVNYTPGLLSFIHSRMPASIPRPTFDALMRLSR
jgi:hypothetical protein